MVYSSVEGKLKESYLPTVDSLVDSVDIFGIAEIAKGCSSRDGIKCAQSVLGLAKEFDPTGLLTIAATFVQSVCDVPGRANCNANDIDYFENEVELNCFAFYEEKYFEGNVTTICRNDNDLQNKIPQFKSMKSSIDSSFAFSSESNYVGTQIIIGKGGLVEDLENSMYMNHLKSVRVIRDECIFLTFKQKEKTINKEICESLESIDQLLSDNSNQSDELFNLGNEMSTINV